MISVRSWNVSFGNGDFKAFKKLGEHYCPQTPLVTRDVRSACLPTHKFLATAMVEYTPRAGKTVKSVLSVCQSDKTFGGRSHWTAPMENIGQQIQQKGTATHQKFTENNKTNVSNLYHFTDARCRARAILLCGRWKTGDELPPSPAPKFGHSPSVSDNEYKMAPALNSNIEGFLSTSTTHLQSTENSENVLENRATHRSGQDAKQPGNTEKRTED